MTERVPAHPSTVDPSHLAEPPALVPAERSYTRVLLLQSATLAVPLLVAAAVLELFFLPEIGLPRGLLIVPAALVALWALAVLPARRRAAMAHSVDADQLRVLHGRTWHSDTIVPFARVQHIDVEQGPVERTAGLARLVVHTAGNHNSEVVLAGLPLERAHALRDMIRARIVTEPL